MSHNTEDKRAFVNHVYYIICLVTAIPFIAVYMSACEPMDIGITAVLHGGSVVFFDLYSDRLSANRINYHVL